MTVELHSRGEFHNLFRLHTGPCMTAGRSSPPTPSSPSRPSGGWQLVEISEHGRISRRLDEGNREGFAPGPDLAQHARDALGPGAS